MVMSDIVLGLRCNNGGATAQSTVEHTSHHVVLQCPPLPIIDVSMQTVAALPRSWLLAVFSTRHPAEAEAEHRPRNVEYRKLTHQYYLKNFDSVSQVQSPGVPNAYKLYRATAHDH